MDTICARLCSLHCTQLASALNRFWGNSLMPQITVTLRTHRVCNQPEDKFKYFVSTALENAVTKQQQQQQQQTNKKCNQNENVANSKGNTAKTKTKNAESKCTQISDSLACVQTSLRRIKYPVIRLSLSLSLKLLLKRNLPRRKWILNFEYCLSVLIWFKICVFIFIICK